LIEPGLDRFVLVSAGRDSEVGPLVYWQQEMPLRPEQEVQAAFLDDKTTVADIAGVTPALDAAFRMECWQRVETARRRLELAERFRGLRKRKVMKTHTWRFSGELRNGTWLWVCSECASDTWTQRKVPPLEDDLRNAGVDLDCNFSGFFRQHESKSLWDHLRESD
jgi:hypothetical protein